MGTMETNDGDDGGEHQQTFVPGAQPRESSGGVRAQRLHLGALTTGPTSSRAYNGELTSRIGSGSPADMVTQRTASTTAAECQVASFLEGGGCKKFNLGGVVSLHLEVSCRSSARRRASTDEGIGIFTFCHLLIFEKN